MKRGLQAAAAAMIVLSMAAAAGDIRVEGRFISAVPTGTAPLEVSSTTLVENLNADLLKGMPASAFEVAVGNVIRVGKTGGDFTSIQAALDSITDAASDNWYVIRVGPGIFDESVTLKSHVSLIGHGDFESVIRNEGTGDRTAVTGASLSFISDMGLTAISTDGADAIAYLRSAGGLPLSRLTRTRIIAQSTSGGVATGVKVTGNTSVTLDNSSVFAQNASSNVGILTENDGSATVRQGKVSVSTAGNNFGVRMRTGSGSLFLQDTAVTARNGFGGRGVESVSGGITILGGSVTGAGSSIGVGLELNGGNVEIRNSQISGDNASLDPDSITVNIAYSEVNGFIGTSGTMSCIGLYDSSMSPVPCP